MHIHRTKSQSELSIQRAARYQMRKLLRRNLIKRGATPMQAQLIARRAIPFGKMVLE